MGASDGSFEVPVGLRPLFDRRTTYGFELVVMGLAFGLAYLLRFDFVIPPEHRHRKGLALRVFEYAAALAAEHGLPVPSG